MIQYYLLLLVMTMLGAAGSLYLKRASDSNGIRELVRNCTLYLGGGLYFLSALLNIVLLRHLAYSVVLPLTSLTYIWTMLLSHFILGEKIGKKQVTGICMVTIGAVMLVIG